MTDNRPRVPCGICSKPTPMSGTKRCDRCWELETRINCDRELAMKILAPLIEDEMHKAIRFLVKRRDQGRIMGAWRTMMGVQS